MVGEIFQEILFSLPLAAIVVCFITTILVLVPHYDEVGKNGNWDSVTDSVDKEELYERKRGYFGLIRDLGKGKMIGFSGLEISSKVDDHEEEGLKGKVFDSCNAAADDNEAFSGDFENLKVERERVGGVQDVRGALDEFSERPTLTSEIKEEQKSLESETVMRYILGGECGVSEAKTEEVSEVLESGSVDEEEEGLLFDDWEGIERTELEKQFGSAVSFIGSKSNANRLDNNVRLHLYGLHKVATEGPCHEPPPMALKLSSRAKWNAWKRLGNMNVDMAMEQYIVLLSKSIPEWK